MNQNHTELKQLASHLLAAMLSNPHIYASISDEGASGQQEQKLRLLAIEMAEKLIAEVERR